MTRSPTTGPTQADSLYTGIRTESIGATGLKVCGPGGGTRARSDAGEELAATLAFLGSVDLDFARDVRDCLGLARAVETGTYRGLTARSLARLFASVTTIELSPELAASAQAQLRDLPAVRVLQGHSVRYLRDEADSSRPTLYFLDGHWSGGNTSGEGDECPLLEELRAIGTGHQNDCVLIDDARLFASAPPPPHRPEQWPELTEVFDLLRDLRPDHVVTVVNDQVLAVPRLAKPALDAYGLRVAPTPSVGRRAASLVAIARARVRRWRIPRWKARA